jgi:hypothetical protein
MDRPEKSTTSLIDALITELIAEMPLEARVSTANLDDSEIRILELMLQKIVKYRIDQLNDAGNEELKRECIKLSCKDLLDDAEAAVVVLKKVWKRLRNTHRLRIAE